MPANLHNHSLAQLADMAGELDADVKARKALLDNIKAEISARGVNVAPGEKFVATVSRSTSVRLDTRRLKADLGEALEDYQVESEAVRVLIKPAPAAIEMEAAE